MEQPLKHYLLVTAKPWHDALFELVQQTVPGQWTRITTREAFTPNSLEILKPDKIFLPHWSYLIPESVFQHWECIVFHMTDLPYGRGGSPLQNLVIRGHQSTKISAIRVEEGIDTGPVYCKASLSLEGSARDIFERMTPIIAGMIQCIVEENPIPKPQQGDIVVFKRRKPADGNLQDLTKLREWYDTVRMLDCEGYPPAFLEISNFILTFHQVEYTTDGQALKANVTITPK